jgi:peptidoglycan/LPS O-acetylase OafA/YrhL
MIGVFHVRRAYVYNVFDMRADALLMGCLLALLVTDEQMRERLSFSLASPWLMLPVVSLLIGTLFLPSKTAEPHPLCYVVQPVIIAVLLLQLIFWGDSWRVCRMGVVRFVAQISYALYLYHILAGWIAYGFHFPHIVISQAFLTLGLSVATYYGVERPFMQMRDRSHGAGAVSRADASSNVEARPTIRKGLLDAADKAE